MKMSLELGNFLAIMSIEKKTPEEIVAHMKGWFLFGIEEIFYGLGTTS
jgi:hypothetical protein